MIVIMQQTKSRSIFVYTCVDKVCTESIFVYFCVDKVFKSWFNWQQNYKYFLGLHFIHITNKEKQKKPTIHCLVNLELEPLHCY